jgi:trehalose-6-phosphate synthase
MPVSHKFCRRDPTVQEWVDVLKERYNGMKLIVGRDKLDEVQGVRQKLLAFEAFLEKYTEFQGRAVLIQVALATSEESESHVAVFDVVSRINSRFSTLTYQVRNEFDYFMAELSLKRPFSPSCSFTRKT